MSRKERKYKNRSFVMIGRGMLLKSQEWKELSPAVKLAYLYIKSKFNGSIHGVINNCAL